MIHLEQYQLEEVARCSANNFTIKEIAAQLIVPYKDLKKAFNAPQSVVKKYYTKGRLESEFKREEKLRLNAEKGNITAYQIVEKKRKEKDIEMLKQQILYV